MRYMLLCFHVFHHSSCCLFAHFLFFLMQVEGFKLSLIYVFFHFQGGKKPVRKYNLAGNTLTTLTNFFLVCTIARNIHTSMYFAIKPQHHFSLWSFFKYDSVYSNNSIIVLYSFTICMVRKLVLTGGGSTCLPSRPDWPSPLRHGKSTRIPRTMLSLTPSPPGRTWSHASDSAVPKSRPCDTTPNNILHQPRPNSPGVTATPSWQRSSSMGDTHSSRVLPRLHETNQLNGSSLSRRESEDTDTPVPAPRKRASVVANDSIDISEKFENDLVNVQVLPNSIDKTITDVPVPKRRNRVASLISARTGSKLMPNLASQSPLSLRSLVNSPKSNPNKKSRKARAPLPPTSSTPPVATMNTIKKNGDFDSHSKTENSDHWVDFEANFVEDPAEKKVTMVDESPSRWPEIRLGNVCFESFWFGWLGSFCCSRTW